MSVKSAWVAAGLAAWGAFGCGPRVSVDEEWMIGVFTVGDGPGCSSSDTRNQYHVNQDHTFLEIGVGINGPTDWEQHYRWEPRGEDSFAVIPGEGEELVGDTNREWIISREAKCGPYGVQAIQRDGEPGGTWSLVRGALCVRRHAAVCGTDYQTYFCDGEPEPCQEDDP